MPHIRNRDLMVVMRDAKLSPEMLHAETEWLNAVLNKVESLQSLALVCEVINISRYRVEKQFDRVFARIQKPDSNAFIFIFNKN